MKQKTDKSMKEQRQSASAKGKPACGTLCYIFECRGMSSKVASQRREVPFEISDRLIRKYVASL